ncbi:hypothetical protein BCV70DRAFT_91252 [Testicularia cyperi]|uniref:Uncharacterized protein n=1 Tax=Testicularia cyperi TaxID=1882483 RepID=A0A317XV64_9BASI|nr:hypothetical protein BCV70DRAFT_91252 [Testicularia cyperi]
MSNCSSHSAVVQCSLASRRVVYSTLHTLLDSIVLLNIGPSLSLSVFAHHRVIWPYCPIPFFFLYFPRRRAAWGASSVLYARGGGGKHARNNNPRSLTLLPEHQARQPHPPRRLGKQAKQESQSCTALHCTALRSTGPGPFLLFAVCPTSVHYSTMLNSFDSGTECRLQLRLDLASRRSDCLKRTLSTPHCKKREFGGYIPNAHAQRRSCCPAYIVTCDWRPRIQSPHLASPRLAAWLVQPSLSFFFGPAMQIEIGSRKSKDDSREPIHQSFDDAVLHFVLVSSLICCATPHPRVQSHLYLDSNQFRMMTISH